MLSQLQAGKTSGVDGLPTEFDSHYQDLLAPRLMSLLDQCFSLEALPDCLRRWSCWFSNQARNQRTAPPTDRYLFINVDAKILAKILANIISGVLEEVVHADQTGFMPGKGTDVTPRRLFLNLSITRANSGSRVIASLDTEKALDSVEWIFLWESLRRFFGFGLNSLAAYALPDA